MQSGRKTKLKGYCMNNKEFIADLAQRTGLHQEETQRIMTTLITAMGDRFLEGDTIQMTGFGLFEVKKKMERIMVIPSNGQRMLVPPKLVLGFRPNMLLRDKIKKGGTD